MDMIRFHPADVFVPRTNWALFRPLLICGVYRLISNGEVVYVGQSIRVGDRVQTHWSDRRRMIMFDTVEVEPCSAEDRIRLERQRIKQYRPRGNRLMYRKTAPEDPPNPLEQRYRSISREDQRYIDREKLTLADRLFHIQRLRTEAERRLKHAAALEAETNELIAAGMLLDEAATEAA
jgi:excinuclease UvrABC nuclease subunit